MVWTIPKVIKEIYIDKRGPTSAYKLVELLGDYAIVRDDIAMNGGNPSFDLTFPTIPGGRLFLHVENRTVFGVFHYLNFSQVSDVGQIRRAILDSGLERQASQ